MDGSWTVTKGQNDSYFTNDYFKKRYRLRCESRKKDTGQTQSYSKKIQAESRDGTKKIQAKNKHWRKWRKWRSWRYCQYRQYRQYRHAKIRMRIVRIMRNLTFLTFLNANIYFKKSISEYDSGLMDEGLHTLSAWLLDRR